MDLDNYRQVASGRKPPAYVQADQRKLGNLELSGLSTDELWHVHDRRGFTGIAGPSLLDLKIELADRMLRRCALCERRCGADRAAGETGFCGVGEDSFYFFEQTLWGEEPPLIPSHEVFFSGCNMRCKFCYSWESLLNPSHGRPFVPEEFARMIDRRRRDGAVNLNLIGGEPTVHLPSILRSLKRSSIPTAVVWNSNFFMSQETMRLLDGIVDVYLGDFRFGNDGCASRIGGTDGYPATSSRNFQAAASSGDLIIRHLLLPGHVDCCLRPIARWVAENLPQAPFNLMFQYMPFFDALEDPSLCRPVSPEEEDEARGIVSSLGLNTTRWNAPLDGLWTGGSGAGGPVDTTIAIRPDGKVAIMHLHDELLGLAETLGDGGRIDGKSE